MCSTLKLTDALKLRLTQAKPEHQQDMRAHTEWMSAIVAATSGNA